MKPLRIGMTTFGYLYTESLQSSLESIARAGYQLVEIAPVSPHLPLSGFDWLQRRQLKRHLADLGLTVVSINPPELNLTSPNAEIRGLAFRLYRDSISLAHELGAQIVSVIPGRQGVLISPPDADQAEMLIEQVTTLLKDAHANGVNLALETVPFGFAQPASALAALVSKVDDSRLGICIDVANLHGHEDVRVAVAGIAPRLMLAHLSDTWTHRFVHTSLGRGQVDFLAYLAALREQGFDGPCIYELVDGEDPGPRIAGDLETLKSWGWSA